jgi:ketosteroid isomerase-like protein
MGSPQSLEVVRRAIEAFRRGDFRAFTADAAPEFEYVAAGAIPGAAGVFRGADEFRRGFLEPFWAEFGDAQLDVHELIESGDQVLVSLTVGGRGRQSGVAVSWDLWFVWTLRDGRVVRGQGFTSRDEALAAVGLQKHSGS